MSVKVALIVDDSKTAQIRLRRLLDKYDATVEVAFSAEQALTMLPEMSPDIIFMDHTMDGMDGLDALKIIKSNPNTAMIPVIMYTAQSDDVYVSQARALGALDTLSKDVFKPSNIDDLMVRLHIPRRDPQLSAPATQINKAKPPQLEEQNKPSSESQTAGQKAKPAYENSQLLNALADAETPLVEGAAKEQSDGESLKLRTVMQGIKRLLGVQANQIGTLQEKFEHLSLDHINLDDVPLTVLYGEAQTERARLVRRVNVVVLFSFVCIALLVSAMVYFSHQLTQLGNRMAQPNLYSPSQRESVLSENSSEAQISPASVPEGYDRAAMLDILGWLSTRNTQFEFAQSPFDERQVIHIQELVDRLSQSDFKGTLQLNIHFGNFCLKAVPNTDDWALAPPGSELVECTFYDEVYIESTPDSYLTIPYLQFEQSSIAVQSGELELRVTLAGFTSPAELYPELNEANSVAQWNAIATRNNRLSFTFLASER